mmetsp:Transcript_12982/g.29894  ORF Transcript_12982/g.29894 Transcript_12982/m.29894 type:complete len:434 (-) Transcript_12982:145-1446(-)
MTHTPKRIRHIANALGRDYEIGVLAGANGVRGQVRIAGSETLPAGLGNWILTFLMAWLTAVGSQRCFMMDHPVLMRLFAPGVQSLSCGPNATKRWTQPGQVLKQVSVQQLAAAFSRGGNLKISWMGLPFARLPAYGQHGLSDAFKKAGATSNEASDMGFVNAVAAHWLLARLTPEADAALKGYLKHLTAERRGIGVALHLRTGDKNERVTPASIGRWQDCMAKWFAARIKNQLTDRGHHGDKGHRTLFAMSDSPSALDAVLDAAQARALVGQHGGHGWTVVAEHTVSGVRSVAVTEQLPTLRTAPHPFRSLPASPLRPSLPRTRTRMLPLWFGPTSAPLSSTEWSALQWHSGALLNLAASNASYVVNHVSVLGWLAYSTARERLVLSGGSTYSGSAHLRGQALVHPQEEDGISSYALRECYYSQSENTSFFRP